MWEGHAWTSVAAFWALHRLGLGVGSAPCGISSLWNSLHSSGEGDVTLRGSAAPIHGNWLKSDKKHHFKMVEVVF